MQRIVGMDYNLFAKEIAQVGRCLMSLVTMSRCHDWFRVIPPGHTSLPAPPSSLTARL